MKNKHSIFSAFWILFAFCGIVLGAIHLFNRMIFSRSSDKVGLNGVWKSEYGDIAFSKRGSGPPLLLVHGIGIGAGSGEWDKSTEEFSKTRTVYVMELPGFGNSDKRRMTYNSYYYAKVINDFIRVVIGQRTDAAAYCASCGLVLAGAALYPSLYKSIVAVNPYGYGMGAEYRDNSFVRRALPLPIIGTLVYNFISNKQSILSYLEKSAYTEDNFSEIEKIMENRYLNAHMLGVNNKYAIISLINSFVETGVYKLMEKCPVPLSVVVSGGSPVPMLAEREDLSITEIKSVEFFPNIYVSDEFNELILSFTGKRSAV